MRRCLGAGAFVVLVMWLASSVASAESITLSRAVAIAGQRSPAILRARARSRAADAQRSVARAAYAPSLGVRVAGTISASSLLQPEFPRDPAVLTFRITDNARAGTASAQVRWTAFDFFRREHAVDAADLRWESAERSAHETEAATAAIVATAYSNLAAAQELLELARDTVTSRESSLAVTVQLVKRGLFQEIEEIRSRTRLERAKREAVRAQLQVDDARVGLAVLLGVAPTDALDVTMPRLKRARGGEVDPSAADRRAVVVAAHKSAEASAAAVTAAHLAYAPAVGVELDGSLGLRESDRVLPSLPSRNGSAAAVLSWNVDLSLPARVKAAQADAAEATAALEETRLEARGRVVRAASSLRGSERMLEHARKTEAGARDVQKVTEARYLRGLASPLEVIDAEDGEVEARAARISAELDHATSIIRLREAMGRSIVEAGE